MPDIEHLELDGKVYDITDRVARDSLNEMNDKIEDIKNSSGNGLSTELKTRYDTATLQSMYNEVIEPSPEEWFTFDSEAQAITGLNEEYEDVYSSDDVIDLVIPYSIGGVIVKRIGSNAFSDMMPENIQNVRLPNCITHIGREAFFGGKFMSINIPTSCMAIESSAFRYNERLHEVITPIKPNWEILLGAEVFYNCKNLNNIDSIINGVKTIPYSAFYEISAKNVVIPESVDSLAKRSFYINGLNCFTVLNKDCVFDVETFGNMDDNPCFPALIKGYKGSTAETYAKNNGIPFMSIEGTEVFDKADKTDTLEGYGITDAYTKTKIDGLYNNLHRMILSADNLAIQNATNIKTLQEEKADKTIIKPDDEAENITFDFSDMYNSEKRLHTVSAVSIKFVDDEYAPDYISGLSFDSGETPTGFDYTDSGIINWVGTDCVKEGDISIFQPSPNTHYDIVFYFNGVQFIGLVNGFVPATGNVVSE